MPNRYKQALAYAKRGIHVFPLSPGSKLPIKNMKWKDVATTDRAQIKTWFDNDHNYNIGVACEPSGLTVVDIDVAKGKQGKQTWKEVSDDPNTFTVETPSGGLHKYFLGDGYSSGVNVLGPGVDIRANGGYVVGIGSMVDDKPYALLKGSTKIEVLPASVRTLLRKKKQRERTLRDRQGVELDRPLALEAAADYLAREAPAVQGAGGDDHTYKVACRVLDFGISQETALELMLEDWNERCSPAWKADDLYVKIRNAWAYRQEPLGSDSPDSDLDDIDLPEGLEELEPEVSMEEKAPAKTSRLWNDLAFPDEEELPRRPWILGTSLLRGKVSLLIADGGIGKSTLALQMAIAVAANRPEVVNLEVHEQTNVAVLNNEDDAAEMWRRYYGIARTFDVRPKDIKGRLSMSSGASKPFLFVVRNKENRLQPYRYAALKREILQNRVGVIIVDPFVEVHEGVENDNVEMGQVVRFFRQLAVECNCAVLIIHHTTKPSGTDSGGYVGNAHKARGAGSVVGAARVVQTLYTMSDKEAEIFGVASPREYVRLDDAKANLAKMSDEPRWFHKEEVMLMNGDTAAVLKPVKLSRVEREE